MEQRISLITLGVGDLARSRAFYERLGWKPSGPTSDQVVFFQLQGLALGLWSRAALAQDAHRKNDGRGFAGVALAYNVRRKPEVARVLAEAHAAGAKVLKPAQDVFWGGRSGYFEDPDGHVWEVAWNPFFPLDAQGRLSIDAKPKAQTKPHQRRRKANKRHLTKRS